MEKIKWLTPLTFSFEPPVLFPAKKAIKEICFYVENIYLKGITTDEVILSWT